MSRGSFHFLDEDRVEREGVDVEHLRRLLAYLPAHTGLILLALCALLLGTACRLAGPWIIKIVVDRNLTPRAFDGLPARVGLYLAALAGGMLFLYLQMLAVSILGQRVILGIRREMFSRLERLPVSFFDRSPAGRLMTRLTSDIEALQELLSSGLVATVGDVAVLAGTAGILLWMDARLALVTFAVLPPLLLFVEGVKTFIRRANREMRRKLARMNAFLQERVSGIAVIKAFTGEEKAVRGFDSLNRDFAGESVRLTNFYSLYFPGVGLIASVAVALILWRGGVGILSGAVTFGTLVAFLEYAQKFFDPIRDMSDKYNILQSALASAERIFQILDTGESPEYRADLPGRGIPRIGPGAPALEFRDVWFSYRPGEPVLRGVSFSLGEGETGAVVGATGAGKTTVLHLLCRFYEIERGEIYLFGREIREIPREELRGVLSLVPQDPVLFSGTIRGNIEGGGPRVRRAAEVSGVSRFASDWERRLDTAVGERGGRLSVGQRQLVSFARALAREPRLLLLDEATSSVDPVTEHEVQRALRQMLSGRTSLVVAHRLSTILSADRILVMHRGTIRETGTHRELMEEKGIYYRLFTLQFGQERPA